MALNTNGVVRKTKIQQLVKAGISEVVVSVDGRPETHNFFRGANIFNKTLDSIKEFVRLGVDTRFNTTVSKANLKDIRFVVELAKKCGAYVSFIPMRNIGWACQNLSSEGLTKEDMKTLAQKVAQLRHELNVRLLTYFDIYNQQSDYYHPMFQLMPCHSRKNIFIDNKGDVYPCDHLVGLENRFCGGNIREENLLDIWLKGPGLENLRQIVLSKDCTENCEHFLRDCSGGCVSEALWMNNIKKEKVACDRLCPLNC